MNFHEKLNQMECHPIIEGPFPKLKYYIFDFSESNKKLLAIDMNDQREFENYINDRIRNTGSEFGIGKYAENRVLYRRFNLFHERDPRSFHLGIDIWKGAGTEIMAPLEGKIHSFQDNDSVGDYGPTIILEHSLEGATFYTLYGHLSKDSLKGKSIGMRFLKGQTFCSLGDWPVNVNWPPHLHFQIIKNMGSKKGDFPGVCEYNEKDLWMENCPDPNLLLKIPGL